MTILSGVLPSTRDRRELADRMRSGFVKHMADVDRAVAEGAYWQGGRSSGCHRSSTRRIAHRRQFHFDGARRLALVPFEIRAVPFDV